MALHSSLIGGVQVAGGRYVVFGPARGFVSSHRHKRMAFKSRASDSRQRQRAGQPSDAQVYFWKDGRSEVVESERR